MDDTFRKLKKIPFKDMYNLVQNSSFGMYSGTYVYSSEVPAIFFDRHGWSRREYMTEMERLQNIGVF
jgi:hypothetical protein